MAFPNFLLWREMRILSTNQVHLKFPLLGNQRMTSCFKKKLNNQSTVRFWKNL